MVIAVAMARFLYQAKVIYKLSEFAKTEMNRVYVQMIK